MSMYPSSNVQWSDWIYDPTYGQHYRQGTDANGEALMQWESELTNDPSTPRETDEVPDVSTLTLQDPPSPGDGDPANYTTEASSKNKSKSKPHKSSKKESKSSKSKSKSSHRKGKSRAQDEEEEEEEPNPGQASRFYLDHETGQYLPYPGNEQDPGGYHGAGDGDDAALEAAYHESRKYSRDQYSAGGPAGPAAYEPAEPEETPARVEEHIAGTAGEYEPLDPRYQVVHSSYFQPGEVFKVLWPEPAGSRSAPSVASYPETTRGAPSVAIYADQYGGQIFAHFRRFIVIANDQGHCQCVPISTYGKKGCTKSGAKPSQHGIVHDMRSRPHYLANEPELGYSPVRVEITDPSEKISKESRVNYAKLTTVEHNVKVLFVGRVIPEDLPIAKDAVDACWLKKTHTRRHRRQ
ncbi:Hypothetical protein NCS54_01258500 [Fusarium falciforme]|uniref:Hypothetical protein n=1 Tax=Fusarium falciforme TaxID=195108 RepID=UPI0023004CB9|nr:Hypothetical protein NCS54_01258500 [Fusarium falciforme]WAO94978.1 Hypothetical protein NCS54_01258500 [Fusarium falciforme]